jgi:predicted GNAT family acetyltransferase
MAAELAIRDNTEARRFETTVDGHTAVLVYNRTGDGGLVLIHTEVPAALRGRHIGDALVQHALAVARDEQRRIVPRCPFVKAYLEKHPQG